MYVCISVSFGCTYSIRMKACFNCYHGNRVLPEVHIQRGHRSPSHSLSPVFSFFPLSFILMLCFVQISSRSSLFSCIALDSGASASHRFSLLAMLGSVEKVIGWQMAIRASSDYAWWLHLLDHNAVHKTGLIITRCSSRCSGDCPIAFKHGAHLVFVLGLIIQINVKKNAGICFYMGTSFGQIQS